MITPPITRFSGKYAVLSNFHPCPVEYEGLRYRSVEHAFQAAKTKSPDARLYVKSALTAGEAKRRGRTVRLREDWEQVKDQVMRELLLLKFTYPVFRQLLKDTGDALLIEGNTWGDKYWGCVKGADGVWYGENKLGHLLMEIRATL